MARKKKVQSDEFDWIERSSPDTYAHAASGGKWKRYDHLVYLSDQIRNRIIQGSARIIINMPPRHGKSEFISHWVPTWFLDTWGEKRVIITSYGERLAKHFGRKVRNELATNDYVKVGVSKDSKSTSEFETTDGGGLLAVGLGGPITGRGGDLIVIDDPIKTLKDAMSETVRKSQVDWFKEVLYTRLEPNGSIILLMTRWHEDDLGGYLENEHDDDWEVINLPAIAEKDDPLGRKEGEALCPDRYDVDDLKKIKKAVGLRGWFAQFMGRPTPDKGTMWKRDFWKRWTTLPEKYDEIFQSWDTNIKEEGTSYVVGQVWMKAGAGRYLIDQIRGKWGFTDLIKKFKALSEKHPLATRKLIENKATGPAVENTLKAEITGILLVEPEGGKVVRAMAAEPEIEAGNVYLPEDEVKFPWVSGFIEEAAQFPNGKHDDQVDTASQALNKMRSRHISYGSKTRKRKRRRPGRGTR